MVKYSVVVIGFGSIGERHARVLRKQGNDVAVVSSRDIDFMPSFKSIENALACMNPSYVVISNRTNEHLDSLTALSELQFRGKVLVEKPLFHEPVKLKKYDFESLHVGYNLRFHPILQTLKTLLREEKIVTFQAYVGQYLPLWRPHMDYRKSYSAQVNSGGGALLDLSHELDFSLWLLGGWNAITALGGKHSTLDITSDDCFSMLLDTPKCAVASIHVNYLDRVARREIIINTQTSTIHADLIAGTLRNNENEILFDTKRDDSFTQMHSAVLSDSEHDCCTLEEAVTVVELTQSARRSADEKIWVVK